MGAMAPKEFMKYSLASHCLPDRKHQEYGWNNKTNTKPSDIVYSTKCLLLNSLVATYLLIKKLM